MATRSISEIKAEIGEAYVSHPAIKSAYGLKEGVAFDKAFSPVSVESVMFYVVASCIWLVEKMFAKHETEVSEAMESLRPHTLRWYANKAMEYMDGKNLMSDRTDGKATADYYDTSSMTEDAIRKAKVVKYAVATEVDNTVRLSVAGESGGLPTPLSAKQLAGLKRYISQIKDAGVRCLVESKAADSMRVELMVVYDPAILEATAVGEAGGDGLREVELIRDGKDVISEAVREVIARLPFNGEYRNSDLIVALQAIEGVKVVDIIKVEAATINGAFEPVVGSKRPEAGYFGLEKLTVMGKPYYEDAL